MFLIRALFVRFATLHNLILHQTLITDQIGSMHLSLLLSLLHEYLNYQISALAHIDYSL